MGVLFFAELTVSIITQHHVNIQLGFRYATPETPEGESFIITKVEPGKTMDLSGLMADDWVQMSSVGDLYRLLIDNQGKEVVLPIKRDGDEMIVTVMVPELDVPLATYSFTY